MSPSVNTQEGSRWALGASTFHEKGGGRGLVIFQDPWPGDCWQENPREEEMGTALGRNSQALVPGNAGPEPRAAFLSPGQEGPSGL